MLTHISIHNLAITEHLELDFGPGMTVISGETGAGKSIILNALGLTIGDRSSADSVRHGAQRAEVSAVFDLSQSADARQWLAERELDESSECILRRTINADGRSRGYINSRPVPLQGLRELGEKLLDIHGQHEHQSLLKKDTHRKLLDNYGNLETLNKAVRSSFIKWRKKLEQFNDKQEAGDEAEARLQLLTYQVEELNALGLEDGEQATLEEEQYRLSHAEETMQRIQQVNELCLDNEQSCINQLRLAVNTLESVSVETTSLQSARNLLQEALIQVEESGCELRQFLDQIEINPERLQEVETRLSTIYELSRKHRVQPEALPEHRNILNDELEKLNCGQKSLPELEHQVTELEKTYLKSAAKLSKERKKHATNLQSTITDQLSQLGMTPHFEIALNQLAKPSLFGLEEVEFLISMNPGQPAKALQKVASGGELSRISLAIQVVTAESSQIPTLIFDEVDVGIGGATAAIVGQMLRDLGKRGQILSVTHLPQVAASGHQHLYVSKHIHQGKTNSSIVSLTGENRVHEIARMLGGIEITEQSLAHAQEMLKEEAIQ